MYVCSRVNIASGEYQRVLWISTYLGEQTKFARTRVVLTLIVPLSQYGREFEPKHKASFFRFRLIWTEMNVWCEARTIVNTSGECVVCKHVLWCCYTFFNKKYLALKRCRRSWNFSILYYFRNDDFIYLQECHNGNPFAYLKIFVMSFCTLSWTL